MAAWWEALSLLERVFAIIAIPSTLLLVIQTVMLLFGFGNSGAEADSDGDIDATSDIDTDTDTDSDGDMSHDPGLRIFTVRGITAFFAIAGWSGLSLMKADVIPGISIAVAFAAGVLAMLIMAAVIKFFLKLQSDGSIDMKNALGLSGSVYISVPPARCGTGKVNVMLQGQYGEFDAVTDEETPLQFGEEITVIGLSGQSTLVVKRKK